jgi:uncharacterized OB-fold protein
MPTNGWNIRPGANDIMNPPRPRPRLDAENRAFWTGGAEGKLKIMKCGNCGKFTHPPKLLCRYCLSENVAPQAVAGTGVIDSYTINYQPWLPNLEVPYVIARVRLDGAPDIYLTTNIVNCAPEDVKCEDQVRLTFEEQDGIFYPLFEKAS